MAVFRRRRNHYFKYVLSALLGYFTNDALTDQYFTDDAFLDPLIYEDE